MRRNDWSLSCLIKLTCLGIVHLAGHIELVPELWVLPKKIVVEGFAKCLSVVFEENLQTLKKQKDLFVVFQEWSAGLQGRDGHPAEAHLGGLLPCLYLSRRFNVRLVFPR